MLPCAVLILDHTPSAAMVALEELCDCPPVPHNSYWTEIKSKAAFMGFLSSASWVSSLCQRPANATRSTTASPEDAGMIGALGRVQVPPCRAQALPGTRAAFRRGCVAGLIGRHVQNFGNDQGKCCGSNPPRVAAETMPAFCGVGSDIAGSVV